ncbi:MAG: hypothetical protein AAF333_05785 [Planctomycetota bacterium]
MSDAGSYNLTAEVENDKPVPRGRGDGWTLDQHLAEHRRLKTAVKLIDETEQLTILHRSPGRLKYWGVLGVVIGALAGAFAMEILPGPGDWSATHYGLVGAALLLLIGLWIAAVAKTQIRLNDTGLFVRRRPFWPGSRVSVPLSSVRRFKVEKPEKRKGSTYKLLLLTKEEDRYAIVPNIILKRDAYLLAMLLIERVKQRRQHG